MDLYSEVFCRISNTCKNKNNNNTISASVTESFGLNKLLELNYAFTKNVSNSTRETYDFNGTSGKYDNPNLRLTNDFENLFLAHRVGANFRIQEKNITISWVCLCSNQL